MAVSQVCPGLYLSGLEAALKPAVLSSRNITLIVDASGLEGVAHPQLDGLRVLRVPVQDRPHAPLGQYFDLVAERINQNRTGGTLVHCTAGRSRSPALIMAYLMRCEGVSLCRAHELVVSRRPFIRPNAGFWRQLMDYERKVTGGTTVSMERSAAGVLPHTLTHTQTHTLTQVQVQNQAEVQVQVQVQVQAQAEVPPRPAYCLNV